MKICNIVVVLLAAAILSSCMAVSQTPPTTTPNPTPSLEQSVEPGLDQEIEIKFGESVSLEKGKLRIKFKSLPGDSRCPQGVVCVWQGNAEIVLDISEDEISLNTALEPKETTVGNYRIQLRDVLPYPKAGEEYQLEDYRIKIYVSQK